MIFFSNLTQFNFERQAIQMMKIILIVVIAALRPCENSAERCSSIPCVVSAASIIERMNTKIDPCEDFYEYACGSFGEEMYTPDEKSTVDTLSLLNDKLTEYLLTLLSKPPEDLDLEIHKLIKEFVLAWQMVGRELFRDCF